MLIFYKTVFQNLPVFYKEKKEMANDFFACLFEKVLKEASKASLVVLKTFESAEQNIAIEEPKGKSINKNLMLEFNVHPRQA